MWCCIPSLVEILSCLDEEIGLVCWQLVHDMHATETFGIQPSMSTFFSGPFKLSTHPDFVVFQQAELFWTIRKLYERYRMYSWRPDSLLL